MNPDWKEAEAALKQIEVIGNDNNNLVTIKGYAEGLRCVGIGTDAAVFRYDKTPAYAFKVYSTDSEAKKDIEVSVYSRLQGSQLFPQLYGTGHNFLVLSFEQGVNLYDCLLQGIPIPPQVIEDVETARKYIRSQGMNPRDIHLKNVLLQDGRGKVLDVSEYIKEGNDNRWEYLVWAYDHFYQFIDGVKIPSWILETIKHWYNQIDAANFVLEEFSQRVSQLFFGERK